MNKWIKNIVICFIALSAVWSFNSLDFPEPKPPGLPRTINANTFFKDKIIINGNNLFIDTLKLNLKKIPQVKDLYTVSKIVVGKWAKLYTVLKIEESGRDGQNSYYAKNYFNLVGMRYPRKRKTTAIRRGNDYYSVYANWYEGMIDFRYYIEYMEGSFFRKHKRYPKTEEEFINHLYGSYNKYSKWYNDVRYLLRNFDYD